MTTRPAPVSRNSEAITRLSGWRPALPQLTSGDAAHDRLLLSRTRRWTDFF